MESATATTRDIKASREGYLFGPWIDFLGLGGASLICFALLAIFLDPVEAQPSVFFLVILMTTVFNHPHFAHSYQIFYRDFRRKIGGQTPPYLRYRYWIAGIIVPALLVAFYVFAAMTERVTWIGQSVNLFAFLVGWHYVKQGYGMLSVDAVLKRKFFNDKEKKLLIWNAYAGWLFSWIYINELAEKRAFQGLEYFTLNLPPQALTLSMAVMLAISVITSIMLIRRMRPEGKGVPLNGFMAYVTSIYVWLIIAQVNPLFLLVIPAFHSLQYLMVVGRFQLNVETENVQNGASTKFSHFIKSQPVARLVRFYVIGIVLGALGFWILPFFGVIALNFEAGNTQAMLPLIVVWLFINIHHYFLDNVMWRKGNPDVGKHLFAHR